jgi:hypothetical protein
VVDEELGTNAYSKAELVKAAKDAGFTASGRLITDWVTLGLLDRATKRGLGKGKGTSSTWPEEQRNLFLVLVEKRETVKRIATLCNIPVGIWLWWGDRYVPTRQARRALETWAHVRERADSWRAALETANELVGRFAADDATKAARQDLVELIAKAAYGEPFDGPKTLAAFRRVFDPDNTGRVLGPRGAGFVPEHYIFITQARVDAVRALRKGTLDDKAYAWARNEYLTSRREYENQIVPRIAADPEAAKILFTKTDTGLLLPDTTIQQLMNQACVDLLTVLGIYLNYAARANPEPS